MESNLVPFLVTSDYGDVVPPSPPSQYDDEFEGPDIANKWDLSGNTNASRIIRIQEPTYLQMRLDYSGGNGVTTLQASQAIVSPTNFLWQAKVRYNLMPAYYNRQVVTRLLFGFTGASNSRFGVILYSHTWVDPEYADFVEGPIVYCTRAANLLDPINDSFKQITISGLDVRFQVGVWGTRLQVRMSNDGWNWLVIWDEAFSGIGTSLGGNPPTRMFLRLSTDTGANADYTRTAMLAAWDYVRSYAGTQTQK